jgi:hypothetical protein
MDSSLLAKGLALHTFPASPRAYLDDSLIELHNKMYAFWHQQWLATFKQLEGTSELNADDFLRQNEKMFLVFQNRIVSFLAFGFFDLRLKSHREHSYFKAYPPKILDQLIGMGLPKVMTMGQFCVSPEWRKSRSGAQFLCHVQAYMAFRRFRHSDADTLITYTRNDRKVNDLAYMYGSKCLLPKWHEHNVEVDIVYTLKEDLKEHDDPLTRETCHRLWDEQTYYGLDPALPSPLKKAV